MQAAALADGIELKIATVDRSYRIYQTQEQIFRARYTTTWRAGAQVRYWNGVAWYKKPGVATAAVPGTSNHGWGLAVDAGTETDGDAGVESFDQRAIDWLMLYAAAFGWSWEIQSEPWHLRYWAGDAVPLAVRLWELKLAGPTTEEEDGMYVTKTSREAKEGRVWFGSSWFESSDIAHWEGVVGPSRVFVSQHMTAAYGLAEPAPSGGGGETSAQIAEATLARFRRWWRDAK